MEGWRRAQLESELMNVDVDEHTCDDTEDTEGEDNQISYVLHIGIPAIEKVWIRKEYLKLYNCCEDYLKSDRQTERPSQLSSQDNRSLVSALLHDLPLLAERLKPLDPLCLVSTSCVREVLYLAFRIACNVHVVGTT